MLPRRPKTAAEILANATIDPNYKPPKPVKPRKPVSYADALINFSAKHSATENGARLTETVAEKVVEDLPTNFEFQPLQTPASFALERGRSVEVNTPPSINCDIEPASQSEVHVYIVFIYKC